MWLIVVVNNMLVDEFNVVLVEFCSMLIIILIVIICIEILDEILNRLYVIGIKSRELFVILEVL